MITCQGTTQARKSNEHVSISTSASARHEPTRARTCPPCKTGNRRRKPGVASVGRLPPRAAAGLAVRAISMVVRDHASLVTNRDHNLASTTVIISSQRRTCATMLALTSHCMATNTKHPRYAPGLLAWPTTRRNRQGRYWPREKVCLESGGCGRLAFGFAARFCEVAADVTAGAARAWGGEGVGAYGMMREKGGVWGLGVI